MPKVSSEELQRWKLLDEPIFIKGQTIPASRVNFEKILIQSK
jgi:hypothetical protein